MHTHCALGQIIIKPHQNIILKLETIKNKNEILSIRREEKMNYLHSNYSQLLISNAKCQKMRKCYLNMLNNFNTENYHSRKKGKLKYCWGYKKQEVFLPANTFQKKLLKMQLERKYVNKTLTTLKKKKSLWHMTNCFVYQLLCEKVENVIDLLTSTFQV